MSSLDLALSETHPTTAAGQIAENAKCSAADTGSTDPVEQAVAQALQPLRALQGRPSAFDLGDAVRRVLAALTAGKLASQWLDDVLGVWIRRAQASFDTDPPDSDYQRGYLAAIGDMRAAYDAAPNQKTRLKAAIVSAQLHADIMAFIVEMAKHYRRRTSRRLCGIRINRLSRQQALELAYATYDASLDMLGVPFGDPSQSWDRAAAHDLVDEDLHYWEP